MDDEDRTPPREAQPAGPAPGGPASAAPHEPLEPRGLLFGQLWELEMLISGAVVFALVQVAQGVDQVFEHLSPHLGVGGLAGLLLFTYYSKGILYALIACFLLNLAARAYWAGLLGLRSVFPHGVRWERLSYGPLTVRTYRELLPGLTGQIARVDRFCSAIFSFTFVVVVFFAFSILVTGVCGILAWAVDRALFGGERFGRVFYVVLIASAGWLALGPALDKMIGKRLDPEGRPARLIRRLTRLNYYAQLAPLYAPVMLTLFSNVRKRVIYPVFYTVFFGLLALVMGDFFARRGFWDFDGYTYLPAEPGRYSVDPRHYGTLRERNEPSALPWIQSDVVRGPYLKLFIPYSPLRHNEALAERCPGVRPLQGEGLRPHPEEPPAPAAEAAVLRCLARLHRVTVNGAPVEGLALRFSSDPGSGRRGVVAYIPTARLPRGENVLVVQPAPRPARSRRPPDPTYRIPFWL